MTDITHINLEQRGNQVTIETKNVGGRVTEVKEVERNGVKVGIIEGYIATWDIDRGDFFGVKDQFRKGAFLKSIMEHRHKNRQVRLKDHHGRTVGGFPIETVKEDDRGLFGVGEINLEVQQGRELYSLAKQGVITDFSIGFSVVESTLDEQNSLRTITEAIIWEGSGVDEPMNPQANITAVKSADQGKMLPVHPDKDYEWDEEKALENIEQYAKENPGMEFWADAFMWIDPKINSIVGAKLLIADVVDGKLVTIQNAVKRFADHDDEVIAGVAVPILDRPNVIKRIEKQFALINEPSPFDLEEKQYFQKSDVDDMCDRTLERVLKRTGVFSKTAIKALVSRLKNKPKIDESENVNNNSGLKDIAEQIKQFAGDIRKAD